MYILHLPPITPYRQKPRPSVVPVMVIVDIGWVNREQGLIPEPFVKRFPPRDIIETVTAVHLYQDFDPYFWGEVESRFTDDELQSMDFTLLSIHVEDLITRFYDYLGAILDDHKTEYVFHRWLDKDTIMMVKQSDVWRLQDNKHFLADINC